MSRNSFGGKGGRGKGAEHIPSINLVLARNLRKKKEKKERRRKEGRKERREKERKKERRVGERREEVKKERRKERREERKKEEKKRAIPSQCSQSGVSVRCARFSKRMKIKRGELSRFIKPLYASVNLLNRRFTISLIARVAKIAV